MTVHWTWVACGAVGEAEGHHVQALKAAIADVQTKLAAAAG